MDYIKTAEQFIEKQERFYNRPLKSFNKYLVRDFAIYLQKHQNGQFDSKPIVIDEPRKHDRRKNPESSNRISVALITEDVGHLTGGRYYCWFIASALMELGYDVTVYTNRKPVFSEAFAKYKQPTVRVVAAKAKELEAIDVQADIYLGSPISGNIAAARLGEKYNKPSYALIFDPFPMMEKYLGKRTYAGWIPLITSLRSTNINIISLCDSTSEYIYEWLNKRKDQVYSVYPCVNSRELDSTPEDKGDYVVFISRLVKHKNFDHVLKACKNLGINLKVISSVDGIGAEKMVRSMKMQGKVQFHMKIGDKEKFEIIKKARVVINGSKFEGFGMWLIEALACGIPTVCYKYPTIEEISKVAGTGNVYMAKWDDPKDLEAQLELAYKEKKYSEPSDKFNFENMVSRVAEVFSQEPRIGVVTIALNEQKFIGASLRSTIKHPNIKKVAVVEGAVNLYPRATKEGLSVDNTADVVRSVVKEENGEKIIYDRYGWAKDKSELRNRALDLLGKDVTHVLVVDADEVYKQEDLDNLVKAMKENPHVGVFLYSFYHFWKEKNLIAVGSQWDSQMFRCFKYSDKGLRWRRHEAPVVNWQGRFINVTDGSIVLDNVKVYHYGYLKEKRDVMDKLEYYKRRDGHVLDIKDTWSNWKQGQPTQPTHKEGTAIKFTGKHPKELEGVI